MRQLGAGQWARASGIAAGAAVWGDLRRVDAALRHNYANDTLGTKHWLPFGVVVAGVIIFQRSLFFEVAEIYVVR